MSLERITGQRVVDELKAGHEVYMLLMTDITRLTIADWLTGEFAIEEQPADPESPPRSGSGKAAGEAEEAGLGKDPGPASCRMEPREDRGRDGYDSEDRCHRAVEAPEENRRWHSTE